MWKKAKETKGKGDEEQQVPAEGRLKGVGELLDVDATGKK